MSPLPQAPAQLGDRLDESHPAPHPSADAQASEGYVSAFDAIFNSPEIVPEAALTAPPTAPVPEPVSQPTPVDATASAAAAAPTAIAPAPEARKTTKHAATVAAVEAIIAQVDAGQTVDAAVNIALGHDWGISASEVCATIAAVAAEAAQPRERRRPGPKPRVLQLLEGLQSRRGVSVDAVATAAVARAATISERRRPGPKPGFKKQAAALLTAAAPVADPITAPVAAPTAASATVAASAAAAAAQSPAHKKPRKPGPKPGFKKQTPAAAASPTASQPSAPKRPSAARPAHVFVLDTNVLLHDPMSLFRFQEHDIFLPLIVLEELDAHKKGPTEVARNARQVSRMLDELVQSVGGDLRGGLPLAASGHKGVSGRLFFQTMDLNYTLPASLSHTRADNGILAIVFALREREAARPEDVRRAVALVSKDINMRVKASALGLVAEDYRSDKVLDDGDLLYSGALALPADFWDHARDVKSWAEGARSFYQLHTPAARGMHLNQFVYLEAPGASPLHARVLEVDGDALKLQTLRDFTSPRLRVWGINARNREQNFALNVLMDPSIDFVSITGTAGTGKTLLALAAGLAQVLDERIYSEIIMTRATVNVGEDIGFLPGTEEEKMGPWMGALDDNLEFLAKGEGGNPSEWGRSATNDLIRSRIKIKSLNFMRGRTFLSKFLIIDEAQNLTPKQMKTLITRAGPGTKIVCMGNLAQIDTPYLSEGSSGLTYAVDRFKGWPHGAHIQLARGERSRLADFASDVL